MFRNAEQRWDKRWQERQSLMPQGMITARATRVVEGRSPAEVWAFIRPAGSAVLIIPEVVNAFTVPGTGPGAGEQQLFICRHNGHDYASLATVVAVQEAVLAETTSYQPGMPSGARYDLAEVIGGTRLTLTSWADPEQGVAVDRFAVRTALEQHGEAFVLRVKMLMEAQPVGDVLPGA